MLVDVETIYRNTKRWFKLLVRHQPTVSSLFSNYCNTALQLTFATRNSCGVFDLALHHSCEFYNPALKPNVPFTIAVTAVRWDFIRTIVFFKSCDLYSVTKLVDVIWKHFPISSFWNSRKYISTVLDVIHNFATWKKHFSKKKNEKQMHSLYNHCCEKTKKRYKKENNLSKKRH